MSELGDAFTELQSEFARATGKAQKVKIAGKLYDAIIEEATYDEIELSGGQGESGGFRAMIAVADHPKKPEQLAEIESDGQKLQILNSVKTNGVTWTITAGDPSTE